MKINEFFENLKKDETSLPTKLYILSGFTLVMIAANIIMLLFTGGQSTRLKIAQAETQKQTAFIQEYKQQEHNYLSKYYYAPKPAPRNQVELVQNELINKMKNYNLSVQTMTSIPQAAVQAGQPPADGAEFELTFTGAWDKTMQYIQAMQTGSTLISIRSVKLEAIPNLEIRTALKYKVYLE